MEEAKKKSSAESGKLLDDVDELYLKAARADAMLNVVDSALEDLVSTTEKNDARDMVEGIWYIVKAARKELEGKSI